MQQQSFPDELAIINSDVITSLTPACPANPLISLITPLAAAVIVSSWRRLGVSRVYLWDHASQPPMKQAVEPFVSSGLVHYERLELTGFQHPSGKPQMFAYDQ